MTEHLGHDKHEAVMNATGNARNGKSSKTLKGEFGEFPIEITRDRDGSFQPQWPCPDLTESIAWLIMPTFYVVRQANVFQSALGL